MLKLEKIYFSKEELPNTLKVNDVFRIKDNEYIVDDLLTKDLKNEIINMTNEILDRQDERLNGHRKEGHSYMITDKQNGKVFLRDLTENSNIEFEEVSLSKELIDQISQGTILKYSNGNYECLKKD